MNITLETISQNPIQIFHSLRWNGQICCPDCGSVHVYNPEAGQLHICADCHNRFSDTSGTIFHSTKLPLSKWLYAIYLFLTSSRGISSYALARYIKVSQTTAWSMLMKIRGCLHRDIKFDTNDVVAIDEVYLGANWTYKPAFKKYKLAGDAPPNLSVKESKAYYRKRFYEMASDDKMLVLGFASLREPKISLTYIPIGDKRKLITEVLKYQFKHVIDKRYVSAPQIVVTDQSRFYDYLEGLLDEDMYHKFDRKVCPHNLNKYATDDGYSSNRLEAAFSHVRRAWRGIYTRWSRKYTQRYLDEFCYRYNHPLSSKTVILDRIKEFFRCVDFRFSSI